MINSNLPNNSIAISLVRPKSIFWLNLGKNWYRFSRNTLSIVGLVIVAGIIISAIFAPWITPYPEHAGPFVDFDNTGQPPSLQHLCGTDNMGRDIFSRIIFAFRGALIMAVVVLAIAVPPGALLGLTAGYFQNTWIDAVIMRITDIFLSVPPLILALAIAAMLKPTLMNAMIAVTVMWWPWYTRLVYGMASSVSNEYFVIAADLTGASKFHILFREILPNCLSPVFTKMALDVGWVILIGASLSFVGLGEQPPTPALGQMVSDGSRYMPTFWWMTIFPALAIVLAILGFNLLGDGLRDMFEKRVE
ncbi:MAG: ABC transporter permease [Proteobacteria bacterium]|nr:ABC transporter permease [Pseudomonadota bacterium]